VYLLQNPVEKVLEEFMRMNGIKIWDIDTTTFKGKRLRGELLVQLKDRGAPYYLFSASAIA
jgi:hypothetical protein